jgi:hypothetical protein
MAAFYNVFTFAGILQATFIFIGFTVSPYRNSEENQRNLLTRMPRIVKNKTGEGFYSVASYYKLALPTGDRGR